MDMLRHLIAKLRLKQLELICLLADYGTLRGAAKVLNMTPAAASKSLREIESVLEISLFERTSVGMTLTSGGAVVFDYAKGTLDNTRLLIQNINSAKKTETPLKIGTPPFLAWTLLPPILENFYQDKQPIPVRIHEERLGGSSKLLESDVIDILITMKSPSELASLDLNDYFIKTIARQQWHVVCSRKNALAGRSTPLSWPQLADEKWILPPYPTYARIVFNQIIHSHGLRLITPLVEAMNAATTLNLIRHNIGIGLLAKNVIASPAAQKAISAIVVEPELDYVDIVFICKRSIQSRPEITSFLKSCVVVCDAIEA